LIEPIVSVEKTGEFEVRFHLEHPWLPFVSVLTNPAGFASLIPSPKAVEEGIQNNSPVGTGPFVFKEWKRADSVAVVKNPDYWRKGLPYLDEIVFLPIPDHESRYAALVSGQADILVTDRPAHIEKLDGNPAFEKYLLEYRGATVLALNNSKPPLDDPQVRRALALAWDQKQYIAASFRNTTPFAENWLGDAVDCEDSLYPYPNQDKARALISDYGKPVELEYIHTATRRGREAGLIMRQMFEEIGVKINPTPSDFPGIMKQLFGGKYDIASWVIPGACDMGTVSTAILHSKSPWNIYRYSDSEVDRLLTAQRVSTDPDIRRKTLCEIARKVNGDSPFLYMFGRTYHLFAKKNIRGIRPLASGEEGVCFSDAWIER
jgi:4-phytase/acid phosphatase/peptide/nickel transport system substrate-binding protein